MNLTMIIERYQAGFETQYAQRISPDQRHALGAVLSCRTERYGEMKLRCTSCHWQQSCFNSCGHRNCHRCQNHDTTRWLDRQMKKLLPVEYFMVTFTLPYELRAVARQHQADVYSAMFACAASTLKSFGANDTKLGADMGMTAVLHTHSRRLDYHPHIHLVVPGGSLIYRMLGNGVKRTLIGTTSSTITVAWQGSPRSKFLLDVIEKLPYRNNASLMNAMNVIRSALCTGSQSYQCHQRPWPSTLLQKPART